MKFTNAALATSLAVAVQATPIADSSSLSTPVIDSAKNDALRNLPITRKGTELQLNGAKWQAGAANVYWLGIDENVIPPPGQPFYAPFKASYPTKGRITEVMNTVRTMGGRMIRGHTLGISYGEPLSLWPTLTTRNEEAWDTIDWAIYQARQHGLRLQIPLVDNYDYYHGGRYTWLRFYGYNITGPDYGNPDIMQFYNNETIVSGFQSYIKYWLTHVNQYTGLTIASDPTIAIIETGNELSGALFADGNVPNTWTQSIASYVKSLAPDKLIMDGTYGINSSHFSLPIIDIFSDHFYPLNISRLQSGIAQVGAANRTYMAGEFDWTYNFGGDAPVDFYAAIEAQMKSKSPVIAGDAFWSLFMHDVGAEMGCRVFVNHTDGFALQYGNPANSAETNLRIAQVKRHFERVQGNGGARLTLPKQGCPGPEYQSGGT